MNATQPPVSAQRHWILLATGGTIAGLSLGPGDRRYTAARLGVNELIQGVPGIAAMPVQTEQVAQIDSKDMTHAVWHALALRCTHHLASPDVAGIVITHGTDTMEETAYFLDLALAPDKPVVLTGAMRPADASDADGPFNLTDALTVARAMTESGDAMAVGTVVVMAGAVHAASRVRKVHPTRLDAFSSGEYAPLAHVRAGVVSWSTLDGLRVNRSTRVTQPWPHPADWPHVDIVFSHAGADGSVLDACVAAGATGIVVAGTGDATVHAQLEAAALRAQARGVQVVRATRCAEGEVTGNDRSRQPTEMPSALHASPVKARIDLMLRLMFGSGSSTRC